MDAKEIAYRFSFYIAAIAFGIWQGFSATEWIILASFLFLLEVITFVAEKYEWEWAKEPEDATWLDKWAGLIGITAYFGTEYAVQYFYPDIAWTTILLGFVIAIFVIAVIIEAIRNPLPKNEEKTVFLKPLTRGELLSQRKFVRYGFAVVLPLTILLEILASNVHLFEQISGWLGFVCFLWGAVFFGTFLWSIPAESESEEMREKREEKHVNEWKWLIWGFIILMVFLELISWLRWGSNLTSDLIRQI